MRLFYAINFNRESRAGLTGLQDRIRPMIRGGNWTREEKFHLTLHYVGGTDPSELPRFKKALDLAIGNMPPFALVFTGFGAFRQGKHHLIYAKAYSSERAVPLLAERLKEILRTGDMKPGKPHVTLVRKAEVASDTLDNIRKDKPGLTPAAVSTVQLMESRTVNGVLTYLPLYEVTLKNQES